MNLWNLNHGLLWDHHQYYIWPEFDCRSSFKKALMPGERILTWTQMTNFADERIQRWTQNGKIRCLWFLDTRIFQKDKKVDVNSSHKHSHTALPRVSHSNSSPSSSVLRSSVLLLPALLFFYKLHLSSSSSLLLSSLLSGPLWMFFWRWEIIKLRRNKRKVIFSNELGFRASEEIGKRKLWWNSS